jgi:hypothetical protein
MRGEADLFRGRETSLAGLELSDDSACVLRARFAELSQSLGFGGLRVSETLQATIA